MFQIVQLAGEEQVLLPQRTEFYKGFVQEAVQDQVEEGPDPAVQALEEGPDLADQALEEGPEFIYVTDQPLVST